MKILKYSKNNDFTYVIGGFPTLEALRNKPYQIKQIIFSDNIIKNAQFEEIEQLAKKYKIEIIYDNKLIEKISDKGNVYIVCLLEKYLNKIIPNGNSVVLVNPSDSGNVGTILREMLGFGYRNLVIITPGVDHFDPKVIRSSMGSIFSINIQTFPSFEEYLKTTNNSLLMFALNGEYNLKDIIINGKTKDKHDNNKLLINEPFTLVFGNEAHGLSDDIKKLGKTITIKHSYNIDSLNLAISVGIALFYLNTQF